MKCLENGIFARTTLKPLSSIFNLEQEKKTVKTLIENGEWFTVSGLRRTGKTTLVRSIINTLEVYPIYVNLWRISVENINLDFLLEEISKEVQRIAELGRLKELLKSIEKVSFLGVTISLKTQNQIILTNALRQLCEKKKVVLVIDEAEELIHDPHAFKYLAALHDDLAPKLSVVLLGSIVSMKKLLSSTLTSPLYGRVGTEIILKPFDEHNSRRLLKSGFEECNITVSEDIIIEGAIRLGGFAGWLTSFGRLITLAINNGNLNPDIDEILKELEEDSSKIIFGEIARMLYGKKRIKYYLKILKFAAESGSISVSDSAKIIRKVPSTAITYLQQLVESGIMIKENGEYKIIDPLVRRVALRSDFENEVKIRL